MTPEDTDKGVGSEIRHIKSIKDAKRNKITHLKTEKSE